jgi:uncharacterized membrane protein
MMGVAALLWDDFIGLIPAPGMPGHAALATLDGALLIAGGVLINWPRFSAWGAGLLTAVFAIGLVALDLTQLATHLSHFDYWDSAVEPLAITAGGLIAFATSGKLNPQISARLEWIGRSVFALCLFVFGAAHFVYATYSATFVPSYIPPSQMFWVYATGAAHIAAGLAILSGVLSLLGVRLLVVMYILFGILVHAPRIWGAAAKHGDWVEFIVNLALVGVAWIVADSLARKRGNA